MHRFRKISALLLSMLVLFGSTSFSVSMHFCMEQMESIAFFNDAKECEMMAQTPPCTGEDDHRQGSHEGMDGCCEDRINLVEGQDELKEAGSVSMPNLQFFAVLYTIAFYSLTSPLLEDYSYKTYLPPIIERDIPVLVQSFLI